MMPQRMNAAWFRFNPAELPELVRFVFATDTFEAMGGQGEATSEAMLPSLRFGQEETPCRNYVWGTLKTPTTTLLLVRVFMPWEESGPALLGIDAFHEKTTFTYLYFKDDGEWEQFVENATPSSIFIGLGC
ncbi:MAG TPA: hypothetical protein VFT59_01940 [Candidatus Saccharimonadales bacterium]|nr:hypothetical protein [Candidatus Saccharimonadales bacterium]